MHFPGNGLRTIRDRLTYANVASTLALVMAMSGTAYAAATLPAHSVGTKQLKNNAVTTGKIKDGTIGAPDLARGATLTWRGSYRTSSRYTVNDIVTSAGGTYVAVKPAAPGTAPGPASTTWAPLAAGASAATAKLLPVSSAGPCTTAPTVVFPVATPTAQRLHVSGFANVTFTSGFAVLVQWQVEVRKGAQLVATARTYQAGLGGNGDLATILHLDSLLLTEPGLQPFTTEPGVPYLVSVSVKPTGNCLSTVTLQGGLVNLFTHSTSL